MNKVEWERLSLALRELAQTIGLKEDRLVSSKIFGNRYLNIWSSEARPGLWFANVWVHNVDTGAFPARLASLEINNYATAADALRGLLQELFRHAVDIGVANQIAIAKKIGDLDQLLALDKARAAGQEDLAKAVEEANAQLEKKQKESAPDGQPKVSIKYALVNDWADIAAKFNSAVLEKIRDPIGEPELPYGKFGKDAVQPEMQHDHDHDHDHPEEGEDPLAAPPNGLRSTPEGRKLAGVLDALYDVHRMSWWCNGMNNDEHVDVFLSPETTEFARITGRYGAPLDAFEFRDYFSARDALMDLHDYLALNTTGFDQLKQQLKNAIDQLPIDAADEEDEGDGMAKKLMNAVQRATLAEAINAIANNAGWAWETQSGDIVMQFEASASNGMLENGMWFAHITPPGSRAEALYVGDYPTASDALEALRARVEALKGPYINANTKKLFLDSITSYLAVNPGQPEKPQMNQERFNPVQQEESRDYSIKDVAVFGVQLAESSLITRGADAALRKALPEEFREQLEGSEFMNHAAKFLTRLGLMYGAGFAKKKWAPAGHLEKVGFLASAIETQQTADAIADRVVPFLFLFFKNFLADKGVQQVLESAGIPAEAIPEVDQEVISQVTRGVFEEVRKNAVRNAQEASRTIG